MSMNNIIYINKETYEVFYQANVDSKSKGLPIGKGNTLVEAVEIADNYDVYPEYGINFFTKEEVWKILLLLLFWESSWACCL